MSPRLLLDPEPQSVGRARKWVVEAFHGLGRDDLVDSAELGVSELVTNAILHADPPISVRVQGTAQHPRVEVHDTSPRPPEVNAGMADEEQLLSTVGRGLGLVSLYSSRWGADLSSDGKVVWFEPVDSPDLGSEPQGDVFDLDRVVAERLARRSADPTRLVPVRLLGMPAQLFAEFRTWYAEIRRELRILALNHPGVYPLAEQFAEITLRVEEDRAQARGISRLDDAIAAGEQLIDLEYHVTPEASETMRTASELMDRLDEFAGEHGLLTIPAGREVVLLRRWYLGEFVRQAAGEQPTRWTGPTAR